MIILDFDGVLVDSVREVAVTAHNASFGSEFTSSDELEPEFLNRFVRYRYAVQPAGDFLLFATACKESSEPLVQFNSLLEPLSLRDRTRKFFATRKTFIEKDKPSWLKLHGTFEPLFSFLRNEDPSKIVLLTNKNRQAVLELTEHFSMKLKPENVFSGDGGASKEENFRLIMEMFPAPSYSFIDDSIKNLLALKESI